MRELTTSDIAEQEIIVQQLTREKLGGFCAYFNRAIDLLIRLYYRIPRIEDVNTLNGNYLSHVSYSFYMSIFTFRACFVLLERGYYLEANILCRNLIEVFVKMRYFEKHKEKLETFEQPHIGKGPSVTFKTMFDEVLPGYYDIEYRWMLSHMAHGGVGARIFKIDFKSATDRYADTGVFYKERWASLVMNNLTNYIFGYIRFYKHIYPQVIRSSDEVTLHELKEIEDISKTSFEQHIALKGEENTWHKVSKLIWDFN
jgi:hypothetical protein